MATGIDFMGIAKGAEYANTLNQKDDSYYRQREVDAFNFDKAQQEFGQKQQDYALANDVRTANDSMLNLQQSVKRMVNETGVDPVQAWTQAIQNARLEGATPRQEALFQSSLAKQASIMAADAARGGRGPEAEQLWRAAGLASQNNTQMRQAFQDPVFRANRLRELGYQVTEKGNVIGPGGREYDGFQVFAQEVSGLNATTAQSVAEAQKNDMLAAQGVVQAGQLTQAQDANAANAKAMMALQFANAITAAESAGQDTTMLRSLARQQGIDLGSAGGQTPPTEQANMAQLMAPYVSRAPAAAAPAAALAQEQTSINAQIDSLAKVFGDVRSRGLLTPELARTIGERLRILQSRATELRGSQADFRNLTETAQARQAREAMLAAQQAENAQLLAQLQQLLK
jgi:hypothetical protein